MESLNPDIIISWYSILPAVVAISMAFITKQVVPSLFFGIVTGGIVLYLQTGDFSKANIVEQFFLPALGTKSFAIILLIYLWCIGGLIGMWEKTGGAQYFAQKVGKKLAKCRNTSAFFAWLVGILFHQGGTVSTILAGTTIKPVTDQYKISHEELAYIVDSTASPIATLIPFNAWPLYVAGLIVGVIPTIPNEFSAQHLFFSAIPFNFYAIFAVGMTLLFAFDKLPWVNKRMRTAINRAKETGKLDRDGSEPLRISAEFKTNLSKNYNPSLYDFIVPIGLLLTITIIPFTLWQLDLINKEHANWIPEAFFIAALSAMLVASIRGMPLKEIVNAFLEGIKSITLGAIIIAFAITLGLVSKEVHLAQYLIHTLQGTIPYWSLPAILTILCMIIAFATGTSLGTYAVVFPAALPLAFHINPDPFFIKVCFGAVIGGAVFGDQCSPISDTTILSSMFTGCDLMDHVRTQLPLALIAAALGTIASTIILMIHF